MQPYVHARATARKSGRDWREDLPIHEFMDLAKHACPDLRHRLVLHNRDLGPALAAMAFPDRKDARDVALAHVVQDLGWAPSLEAWLERCDAIRLPQSRRVPQLPAEIVQAASTHHDLRDSEPVRAVWEMLTLPLRFAADHGPVAGALLMSSLGPILARAIFGPPRAVPRSDGGHALVDFGWVAEGMIVAHSGTIHSLERVMACCDGREPPRPSRAARAETVPGAVPAMAMRSRQA